MHLAALDGQARMRRRPSGQALRGRRRAGPLHRQGEGSGLRGVPGEHARVTDRQRLRREGGEHQDARARRRGTRRTPGRSVALHPPPQGGHGRNAHRASPRTREQREPHSHANRPGRSASPTALVPRIAAARCGLRGRGSPPRAPRAPPHARAFAHSHSVWPVRASCQATAAATEHERHDRHRLDRRLTRFRAQSEHVETVPPGARRLNARALRNWTRAAHGSRLEAVDRLRRADEGLLVAAVVRPDPEDAVRRSASSANQTSTPAPPTSNSRSWPRRSGPPAPSSRTARAGCSGPASRGRSGTAR